MHVGSGMWWVGARRNSPALLMRALGRFGGNFNVGSYVLRVFGIFQISPGGGRIDLQQLNDLRRYLGRREDKRRLKDLRHGI